MSVAGGEDWTAPARRTAIGAALELIAGGSISVLSLDMFDTTVWRTVPRPTDAFVLLGQRLRDSDQLSPSVDPLSFRRLRMAAEATARERRLARGGRPEVTLAEIWDAFPAHLARAPLDALVEAEMGVELEIIHADLEIVELIAAADQARLQLAVVSNTYLERGDLRRLIASCPGLAPLSAARIYPSCEHSVDKGTGLWPLVLDDLGVDPAAVLHVGDDARGDLEVPAQLGVRTCYFDRLPHGVGASLAREAALAPVVNDPLAANVDPRRGDFGFTALRSKVAARLAGTGADSVASSYGAVVLGPVMAGFSEWVHRRTLELGESDIWCPMREGEMMSAHLNIVSQQQRSGITARPLWLSRAATGVAAIRTVDRPTLERLAHARVSPTVRAYVTRLGLMPEEVSRLSGVFGRRMSAAGVGRDVISFLVGTAEVRERILEQAAAARKRLVGHLEQTIGDLAGTIVLSDLGWAGTIQHNLQGILTASGFETIVHGFYLATNVGATRLVVEGGRMEGYLTSFGAPDGESRLLNLYPHVIEQACLAPVGSLLDFDDDGQPVLDDSVPPPEQIAQTAAVHRGARAFHHEWVRYGRPPLDGSEVPLLRRILRQSVAWPTADEARLFGGWLHFDNAGSIHVDAAVPQDTADFVPYLSPPDVLSMPSRHVSWPLGLAALADPELLATTLALEDGALPPASFDSAVGSLRARLTADRGNGFETVAETAVRINRNGLSFVRLSWSEPGVTRIRLSLAGDRPVLVRMDRIELDLEVDGEAVAVRRSVDSSTVAVVSGRRLDGGVMVGAGDEIPGPEVTVEIPLHELVDGLIDRVEIIVAGAVLTLPDGFTLPDTGGTGTLLGRLRRRAGRGQAEAKSRRPN